MSESMVIDYPPQPLSLADLIYLLILAIGSADLSKASTNARGSLIHKDLKEALGKLQTKELRVPLGRRIPGQIREALGEREPGEDFNWLVNIIQTKMMLTMEEEFYPSKSDPMAIEIRRPEVMRSRLEAALTDYRKSRMLKGWEIKWIRAAGQVLADFLISKLKSEMRAELLA